MRLPCRLRRETKRRGEYSARAVAAARVAAGERTVVQLQHSEDHVVVTTQCPIAAEVSGALRFAVTGKATGFLNE